MDSARFQKPIVVTEHARQRMAERAVDDALLLDLIESGEVMRLDAGHMFIYLNFADRRDNLVCAAAVDNDHLVIKTVMVNWVLRRQS